MDEIVQLLVRPHIHDDNPYSEAHFKTLKYRPISRNDSAAVKMLEASARLSFPAIARITATPELVCLF